MDAPRPDRQALLVRMALLAVVGAVLVGEGAGASRPGPALLVLDGVVGAAAALAAPGLRHRPVGAALALAGLSALVPTVTPVAATAVLWTAERERLPIAAVTAVAAAAGQGVRGLWRPDLGVPTGWWLAVVVLAYVGLVGWGAWLQARRALFDAVVERTRHAERTRIARELHDTLAHRLSLVATTAGALEYNRAAGPERTAEAAGAIRTAAHQALAELREVVGLLREDESAGRGRPQPGVADIAALVEEARAAGAPVALDDGLAPNDREQVPAGLGRTAHRVVQEGLTNARKHASGGDVRVALAGHPGATLEVEVVNGPGAGGHAPAPPGAGVGLVGLRERAELSDGHLEHGPTPSGGFRIAASLPWPR
ncbi:histidine kinase [Iamia majanohamensis]|uniref:histidine kinase n=1 Tax=Iamia majanohamensis TaxID=467976 RepID=A0AAE9YIV4_9ACTN|nr:histidine kinase [Iamia majanohamensis]WCO68816.1 histidine kinase [Iamia majanohamensis]